MKRCISAVVALLIAQSAFGQNARDIAVRKDKQQLLNDDAWVYDDLATALADAETTRRPLMIVFR